MTKTESFSVEQLKAKLNQEHQRLLNELMMALKNLHQRTEITMESLRDGNALDSNLIVNASGISESIARWNLVRDLIPYLYEELPEK